MPNAGKGSRLEYSVMISVVIPAYNEAHILPRHLASLLPILAQIAGEGWEVLIVDDGSSDATGRVLPTLGYDQRVAVIRSDVNRGKGAAIRLGVAAARGDLVLTCDADMSTPPETLFPFVGALQAGADIVIGNRRSSAAQIEKRQPWIRRFLGTGYLFLCQLLTRARVEDFNCGFKLFRGDVARSIMAATTTDGWAIDMESLALASRCNCRVVELPVVWRDSSRSSVRLARDIPATLRELVRVYWRLCRSGNDPRLTMHPSPEKRPQR